MNEQQKAKKLAGRVKAQVRRGAGKGLKAAAAFLAGRVKETLGVPAPKARVKTPSGEVHYRALTPAAAGAPPRLVSGALRRSVGWTERGTVLKRYYITANARGLGGFRYPEYHEARRPGQPGSGRHPFVAPTAKKYRRELRTIIGGGIAGAFRKVVT